MDDTPVISRLVPERPPVLIIGRDSLIGKALLDRLTKDGVPAMGTVRRPNGESPVIDLADDPAGWRLPLKGPSGGFRVAVLCAGETSIAHCAAAPGETRRVNVDNTVALSRRLLDQGTRLLFLSTSMVFDGLAPFQKADDPVHPITEYGRQKAAAEEAMLAWGANVTVLRLTKVLSPTLPLFQGWGKDLITRRPIRAFEDLRMAPVRLDLVVEVLCRMAADPVDGIVQLSADRDISYADAARHLAERLGAPSDLVEIASAEAAGIPEAARPRYTTLDAKPLALRYDVPIDPPEAALDALAARLSTPAES